MNKNKTIGELMDEARKMSGEPVLVKPHQLNTYLQTIDKSKKIY